MTRALLDINVLLALLDSDHIEHERAHAWIDAEIDSGWASCAITQNGFVRVDQPAPLPEPCLAGGGDRPPRPGVR